MPIDVKSHQKKPLALAQCISHLGTLAFARSVPDLISFLVTRSVELSASLEPPVASELSDLIHV